MLFYSLGIYSTKRNDAFCIFFNRLNDQIFFFNNQAFVYQGCLACFGRINPFNRILTAAIEGLSDPGGGFFKKGHGNNTRRN